MYNEKTSQYTKLVFLNRLLIVTCLILAAVCLAFLADRRTSVVAPVQSTSNRDTASPNPGPLESPPAAVATPKPVAPEPRRITVDELSTTDLFKSTSPSVVHITTEAVQRDFFDLDLTKIPKGSGSGFVWDKQGHVVTNYHVIRDADFAHVALADHTSWPAKLVGVAPDNVCLPVIPITARAESTGVIASS